MTIAYPFTDVISSHMLTKRERTGRRGSYNPSFCLSSHVLQHCITPEQGIFEDSVAHMIPYRSQWFTAKILNFYWFKVASGLEMPWTSKINGTIRYKSLLPNWSINTAGQKACVISQSKSFYIQVQFSKQRHESDEIKVRWFDTTPCNMCLQEVFRF